MSSSSEYDDLTWGEWFTRLSGHESFCVVDQAYFADNFNMYGLRQQVPHYSECLEIMLDQDIHEEELEVDHALYDSLMKLYGLVHARFIITNRGMELMKRKYEDCDFGVCPRYTCHDIKCLPVGISDLPDQSELLQFCPLCKDIFLSDVSTRTPTSTEFVDGAYFGTTFAHLFLLQFPSYVPVPRGLGYDPEELKYVPRVFGFRIYDEQRVSRMRSMGLIKATSSAAPHGGGGGGVGGGVGGVGAAASGPLVPGGSDEKIPGQSTTLVAQQSAASKGGGGGGDSAGVSVPGSAGEKGGSDCNATAEGANPSPLVVEAGDAARGKESAVIAATVAESATGKRPRSSDAGAEIHVSVK